MMEREEPITGRELRMIRSYASDPIAEGDDTWPNTTVLKLIAEIDRLTYMVWRGGPDELITGEGDHLVINGSHACAPEKCSGEWFPPPAESWTLPVQGG